MNATVTLILWAIMSAIMRMGTRLFKSQNQNPLEDCWWRHRDRKVVPLPR
jgi:hypothetical protein